MLSSVWICSLALFQPQCHAQIFQPVPFISRLVLFVRPIPASVWPALNQAFCTCGFHAYGESCFGAGSVPAD